MTNDLTISGAGQTAVATDELYELAQRLEDALATVREVRWVVSGIAEHHEHFRYFTDHSAVDPRAGARHALELAGIALAECEVRTTVAATALRLSATAYGVADDAVDASLRRLMGVLGYGIGFLAPSITALLAAMVVIGTPGILLSAGLLRLWTIHNPDAAASHADALNVWLGEQKAGLTNPATVALIGHLMTSADETGAGLLRLPPVLPMMAGEDGLALTGVSSSALLAVLAGGQFGLLVDGAVSARRTSSRVLERAPSGLAERVDRLPNPGTNDNGEQIRIDRFQEPGKPDRFEVFIAGTVDFSPAATGEPFDLTSNLHSIAQLPAGSERAVREAMSDAGIRSTSPVIFTGHSQGGMIAANLAASNDFTTQGVFTIGAPDGAIVIDATIPVIAIAHTDDIVPVLNGPRLDRHTIVVERHAFADRPVPSAALLPAHERGEYRVTASQADSASHEELSRAIANLDRMTRGSTPVSTTLYLARRTVP